jgi:hypothetical protein
LPTMPTCCCGPTIPWRSTSCTSRARDGSCFPTVK